MNGMIRERLFLGGSGSGVEWEYRPWGNKCEVAPSVYEYCIYALFGANGAKCSVNCLTTLYKLQRAQLDVYVRA